PGRGAGDSYISVLVPPDPARDRKPTREEFVREAIGAMKDAGFVGDIFYDDFLGLLTDSRGLDLEVHSLYAVLGGLAPDLRRLNLANAARAVVRQDAVPERWGDARDHLLPRVRRRSEVATEN